MKNTALYYIWAGLYALCFGLSLIPTPSSALQVVMTLLSFVFFVPPAWLLVNAFREKDQKTLKLVRLLSILSLSLTFLFILLNIIAFAGSEALGNFLHYTLVFFSVPMFCSGSYALGLFLWACLLFSTFVKIKNH